MRADLAGIACTVFALAWVGSANSVRPRRVGLTPTVSASRAVHDSIPCTGERWPRQDDTTKAVLLAHLAMQMQALADSADSLVTTEEGPGPHEFFTSAAEVAFFAAAYGPDHLPTLLIASQLTERGATIGEGVFDTVLAKRAVCYAKRAVSAAQRQGDQASLSEARKLLQTSQEDLQEGRRNAALERRRRP